MTKTRDLPEHVIPAGAPEARRRPVGRRWVLPFAAGLIIAGGAAVALTWNRPSKDYLRKAKELVGLGAAAGSRYAHGLERLVRDGALPDPVVSPTAGEWLVREGFDVELVADGFTYPVNIVFDASPGGAPESPVFYVNELHGAVKYVARDGRVRTLCDGILNYPPEEKEFSDELGISGLCQVPGSRDLLLTFPRKDPKAGRWVNVVVRLELDAAGTSVTGRRDLLVLAGEFTSPSHQIQGVGFGPDGKVWIGVGDGMHHPVSLDLDKWGGKILRCEPDGRACADNPFFDPARPGAPRSYVWAYGVRNPFAFSFDPRQPDRLVATDNGVTVDRLMRVVRGANYGWNGTIDSLRTNALFCWGPPATSPAGITFLRGDVLGPERKHGLFVALFGPDRASGIVEAEVDPASGLLAGAPTGFLQHRSRSEHGLATVLGLAEGPDGLYFTDFFGSTDDRLGAGAGGVWRLYPTERTRGLPRASMRPVNWNGLLPGVRGEYLVKEELSCKACHVVDGKGSNVGPSLDGVAPRLTARVGGDAYLRHLDALEKSGFSAVEDHRAAYAELRSRTGGERALRWIVHHLRDPRFDNLLAKMPSFSLPEEDLKCIGAYLMTLR